jgi:excisionase family DNA binding protein
MGEQVALPRLIQGVAASSSTPTADRSQHDPLGVSPGVALLTASEVAELLRVPKSWVYRAAREGSLPSVRCGRYRRFDVGDVDRWIESQKVSDGAA